MAHQGQPLRQLLSAPPIQWLPRRPFGQFVLMMRPGVVLCAAMACLCLALVASGYPRAAPGESVLLGLGRCADTPCFRGITPASTSWADALAAFEGSSITYNDPEYVKIALLPSEDGDRVGTIYLERPLDPSATAASVAAIYGEPMCVEILPQAETLILHYPLAHIVMRFSGSRFKPETPIIAIMLGEPVPNLQADQSSAVCSGVNRENVNANRLLRAWRGFANLSHYINQN